jgi:hypothetical protein
MSEVGEVTEQAKDDAWKHAAARQRPQDWCATTLDGIVERSLKDNDLRFGRLDVVLSADELSIGLVMMRMEANAIDADGADEGPVTFWLSRPDAQRLGLALLAQAPSELVGLDEGTTLRIPSDRHIAPAG